MATVTASLDGGAIGTVKRVGPGTAQMDALVTITFSGNYTTGGETFSMPTDLKGDFVGIQLLTRHDGTRFWDWDGSTSTPKLKAYDAFATEEGAGTSIASTTLKAIVYVKP